MLASVTFVNESASGWQQQTLTTPVAIAVNTTYVVSVNTGNSYFVATTSGLASQVSNGNLSSVVGNNGVYGTAGMFPTNVWQASNYFRDVLFVPDTTGQTLFTTQVPAQLAQSDGTNYELGTQFQSRIGRASCRERV